MGRFLKWLFLVLLVAFGAWVYFFLQAAGAFLDIKPVSVGACRQVNGGGIVGVEDLAIDAETKLAFLAGYDRRRALGAGAAPDPKNVRGAIWTYDLNAADAQPVDATATALPEGFWPHGISLYRGADGRKTLFVISHAGGKHTVEVFDVAGSTLTHRRTVAGPEMVSPNDLVGVSAEAFYVTNDHANVSGWQRTAEDYLRLRLTTVQYFDGTKFTTALSGLGGSNGINVSADGRSLYVSAGSERTVYVYDRDATTGALKQRAAVVVPGYADNLDVLANGDLLLGAHSKIFPLLEHFGDATKRAPSHIVHLRGNGKGGFASQTIYYNTGEEISGASVGASVDKRLLIGAIFEPKILDCVWDGAP
jgi:arylesterase / paraoxonase